MPVAIRKLSDDEASRTFPKREQMDLGAYMAALADLEPGDGAAIREADLSSRSLKRRVGQAAKQLGMRLKWSSASSEDGFLYIQVLQSQQRPPVANGRRRGRKEATAPESPTTPKLRGRKKKTEDGQS